MHDDIEVKITQTDSGPEVKIPQVNVPTVVIIKQDQPVVIITQIEE